MNTWTPLWSGIVDSSIWTEPDEVRIVFITLLALKDSDHVVRHSAFAIARKANKTEAEVLDAFKVLESPDKKRLEPQPFDGRRIKKVEDGWLILNGEIYRKKVSEEMRKARVRRAQSTFRQKQKNINSDTPPELPSNSEIPTEQEAFAMTMTVGIPEPFSAHVYADWASRSGKDASGVVVAWLPYVTKRWAREALEWRNGKHKGKKAVGQPAGGNF